MSDAPRRTPLWLLACSVTSLPPLLITAGVLIVAGLRRSLSTSEAVSVAGLGLGCSAMVAAVVAVIFGRLAKAMQEVERASLVPVASVVPTAGSLRKRSPRADPWITTELVGLAAGVQTLRARVRIADEVADRHRRDADDSAAGVFRLVAGLVAAEEGARGQLSAELHDTVAQSLLSARMLLADGHPQRASDAVDDAEEQVRALMARTRPPELREGDLAEAVCGLRDDLDRRYGLRVQISWPASPRPLPLAVAVVVYRFFQESLLNVVKHAESDDAEVSLIFPEQGQIGLQASVSDSGAGFVQSDVTSTGGRHVGLALMRERARLSGGSVQLTSRPGVGTTVALTLPRSALGTPPADLLGMDQPQREQPPLEEPSPEQSSPEQASPEQALREQLSAVGPG